MMAGRSPVTAAAVAIVWTLRWEVVSAKTIVVHPDGTGDLPTIQAAIDASADGDEVVLTDGVFRGQGNYSINFRGKGITVRSLSGDPGRCVIDCEGVSGSQDYRFGFEFRLFEGSDSIVEGITVTRGWYGLGGAILCYRGSPLIRNCVFEDNVAWQGGAIHCQLSSAVFENCVIVNNRATELPGGGAFVGDADIVFRACTFSYNESGVDPSGDRQGGGISIHANSFSTSSVILEHCIVSHSSRGEAIFCDERSTATISCTDIYGNAGGDWVGSIANQAGQNGNFSLDPIFCDIERGYFGLAENSPCAPGASLCGLIGALEVSCTTSGVMEMSWGKLKALYRP
jgi:hypothetical protein